jgi:microcin C transport system substrate-binding protein
MMTARASERVNENSGTGLRAGVSAKPKGWYFRRFAAEGGKDAGPTEGQLVPNLSRPLELRAGRPRSRSFGAALLAALLLTTVAMPAQIRAATPSVTPVHAIAIYGTPKYPPGFDHFDYVNPNAPKGGEVRVASLGTFDSFNPFIVKGIPPVGGVSATESLGGLPFETLLAGSADEPASAYGLIAESIELPQDRTWVAFNLRPEARFQDGTPITADDVVFSFEILKAKGAPSYRSIFAGVLRAEKLADRKVRFVFANGDNRELPVIVGSLPVLSKKYWQNRAFDQTTLEPPLGSGPYKVESFEVGRYVVLKRVADYWGKDLPVNKGRYNFDRIRIDFYRDSTVALEAFKAGDYDFRFENESKKWATGYDFPAARDGQVKLRKFENERTQPIQGFAYNLRRPIFQDPKVRAALAYAFDFEWTDKNLFYGQYTRTKSYFPNSELTSTGLPSPEERQLLDPWKDSLPPELFTSTYAPPSTDPPNSLRSNLRIAIGMLKDAGWVVKGQRLVNGKTGQPFTFEVLIDQPVWERICLPFIENLKRLGIEATVRTVDTAQYKNRMDNFDYDMTVIAVPQGNSPGNEQREFWGSASADQAGSFNIMGIKSPAIDSLVEKLVQSPDRQTLVTRVHALDRALLWGYYVIPHWYLSYDRVAFWDKFGMPETVPSQGFQFLSWWVDTAKTTQVPPPSKAAQGR